MDESNLAKLDSCTLFNLLIGLSWENLTAELCVMNLTDEEAWQTGARWTDFSSPSQFSFLIAKQGVAVSPLDKRGWPAAELKVLSFSVVACGPGQPGLLYLLSGRTGT